MFIFYFVYYVLKFKKYCLLLVDCKYILILWNINNLFAVVLAWNVDFFICTLSGKEIINNLFMFYFLVINLTMFVILNKTESKTQTFHDYTFSLSKMQLDIQSGEQTWNVPEHWDWFAFQSENVKKN